MKVRSRFAMLVSVALIALPAHVTAQHSADATPLRSPPREATQFDFLVGQWDLIVRPQASGLAARIHGAPTLVGTWKAWRALDGFGVQDELRITDESGNPRALAHAVRYYDAPAKQWKTSTIDPYRGVFSQSSAEFRDGRMNATARGTDADGKPYVSRSRFYDITPTSFKFRQDRSTDDGRTWNEGVLIIQAKRVAVAAPR